MYQTVLTADMQLMDKFVQNLQPNNEAEELSPQKMRVLKQLLEHYNVKNLNQKNYESTEGDDNVELANTFGLRIHSVKYEELPRKR